MAGNESNMRQQADDRLSEAKRAGVKGADLAQLQASRDAARSTELSATGGNRQAGER